MTLVIDRRTVRTGQRQTVQHNLLFDRAVNGDLSCSVTAQNIRYQPRHGGVNRHITVLVRNRDIVDCAGHGSFAATP